MQTSLYFSSPTSSFPPLASAQLGSTQLSSTRLNSAQLTTSSQLSSSYQPINSSRLSSTNSQDYHLPHNKSGRGGREIFLVVAGSRLVVLDGCCALRASPSGSTQRGTAPRPFAPTFPATLRRHRRRPFADTGGDLSLSTSESHSTYNVTISSIPFQLRVKLEANDGKFRIRLRSFSAQVEGSDRSISSTSRLRVGIHHDWRLRLQTTTYVRPKSATRAEVYRAPAPCPPYQKWVNKP